LGTTNTEKNAKNASPPLVDPRYYYYQSHVHNFLFNKPKNKIII